MNQKLLDVIDAIGHLKLLSTEERSKLVPSIDGQYNPHILHILKRYNLICSDDRFSFLGTVEEQISRLTTLRNQLDK